MNDFLNLTDKTILITGASSGIGRATSLLLEKLGARLILSGRNETELTKTYNKLKNTSTHRIILSDINSGKGREDLANSCPSLNGFVCCAGVLEIIPIQYLTEQHLEHVIGTNLNSTMLLTSKILRLKKFNKYSSLIYLSSISSNNPYFGGAAYSASKAGLETYCKSLAHELLQKEIRVNCIAPAMVNTPMLKKASNLISQESMDSHIKKYPFGIIEPEDVANSILFLLSDLSRKITGTKITIDSGFLLNR